MATVDALTPQQLETVAESKHKSLCIAYEMLRAIQAGKNFDTADYLNRLSAISKAIDLPTPAFTLTPLTTPDAYRAVTMTYLDITFTCILGKLDAIPVGDTVVNPAVGRGALIEQAKRIIDEYKRRAEMLTNPTASYQAREAVRKGLTKLYDAMGVMEQGANREWAVKL